MSAATPSRRCGLGCAAVAACLPARRAGADRASSRSAARSPRSSMRWAPRACWSASTPPACIPAAARALPQVGYMRALSAEGVLSLKPTLVIATTAAGPATTLDQLRATGVEVLVLPDHYDYDSVVAKIAAVGKLTGKTTEADAMIARGRADMAEARGEARWRGDQQPRVLFLLSMGGGAPQAAGRDTAADGIISWPAASNAVDGYDGYRPLTPEAVIASRADFVLVTQPDRAGDGRHRGDPRSAGAAPARRPAGPARCCSSTRCCCWASARARPQAAHASCAAALPSRARPARHDDVQASLSVADSARSRSPPPQACVSAASASAPFPVGFDQLLAADRPVRDAARRHDGRGALRHSRAARARGLRRRRRARRRRRGDAEPVPQSAGRSRPARRVERCGARRRVGDRAGREGDPHRAAGPAALVPAARRLPRRPGRRPSSSIASPRATASPWSARCCWPASPSTRSPRPASACWCSWPTTSSCAP